MAQIEADKVLSNVKEDLAIEDALQDKILMRLITKVTDHFKFKYDQKTISEVFSFIIEDCTIKRFNRRRAEGAVKRTQEGFSVEYDVRSEFDEWDEDIRRLLGDDDDTSKASMGRLLIFP